MEDKKTPPEVAQFVPDSTATAPLKTPVKRTRKKISKKISKGKKAAKKTGGKVIRIRRRAGSDKAEHIRITDSTPKTTAVAISKDTFGLALLSPFRYPINYNSLASQTARVSGAFFVMVGAFFTLVNAQYIGVPYDGATNVAQTVTGTVTAAIDDNVTSVTSTAVQPEVNMELDAPDPNLGFVEQQDNGIDTVSGLIDVFADVDGAERIEVYLKDTSGSKIKLGGMIRSDNRWKFVWDTAKTPDGKYDIFFYVTNSGGTYDDGHESIEVVNHTSGTGTVFEPPVRIEFEGNEPFEDEVRMKMTVPDADVVNVYVDDVHSGEAEQDNDDSWSYIFDSSEQNVGTHTLYAEITLLNGHSYTSETLEFRTGSATDLPYSDPDSDTLSAPIVSVTDDGTGIGFQEVLKPEVRLDIEGGTPLSGIVEVRIDTKEAQFIEVYAVARYALTEIFLGLASHVDSDKWIFTWNSEDTPSGEYSLFARVKNQYGMYDSERFLTTIFNDSLATTSQEQEEYLKKITTSDEPETVFPVSTEADMASSTDSVLLDTEGDLVREKSEELLIAFKDELLEELDRYSAALRDNNESEILDVKRRLQDLRRRIIDSALIDDESRAIIAKIDAYLEEFISALETEVVKSEQLIRERVGDAVFKDSDADGISDYDEVNQYETDPFSADTDGDGFIDGAEILSGYDPKDTTPEVLVTYESPRDAGVIREDILSIDTIASVDQGEDEGDSRAALITGKALPHSFITLYIYSTPVVVTVKTNDDGSWSYRFDKELEDGEHEVYIGMTDNAGKIVAKSNPFLFIKTAEAFTPVSTSEEAITAPIQSEAPIFLSERMILVVLSIAVVALGLVLMLLGLHMRTRLPKPVLNDPKIDLVTS